MPDLSVLVNFYSDWISALSGLWTWFNTPISSIVSGVNPNDFLDFPLLNLIITGLGFANMTPLEFMFTGGLVLYIVYQFIVWILNLIT